MPKLTLLMDYDSSLSSILVFEVNTSFIFALVFSLLATVSFRLLDHSPIQNRGFKRPETFMPTLRGGKAMRGNELSEEMLGLFIH